jgi:branched-chain amino acid aminotransferase
MGYKYEHGRGDAIRSGKILGVHPHVLHNRDIRDSREALLSPGQVGFLNGWGVFSTLRVTDGTLFAFERHYARLKRDASLLRVPFPFSAIELLGLLRSLIERNEAWDAVLRVVLVRNKGGTFEVEGFERECDLLAFTAPLTRWSDGVHLSYVANGRFGASPFSGTKLTSWAQNLTWYEKAHAEGFDEVILLNEHGEVSECTSANLFIVRDQEVWTPPLATSGCLPGVTRAVLLEEIKVDGVTIGEKEFRPSDLEESDSVFITSSTRDLIPVSAVDGAPLRQEHAVLNRLRDSFVAYRAAYTARVKGPQSLVTS